MLYKYLFLSTQLCGTINSRTIESLHIDLGFIYCLPSTVCLWKLQGYNFVTQLCHGIQVGNFPTLVFLAIPLSKHVHKETNKQTNKSVSELYRQNDRRLSAKLVQTFEDRGCWVVSRTDPCGRILDFVDRNRYSSSKLVLSCTHETEWTPFQTHYFSETLVVPGIETRTSGSVVRKQHHKLKATKKGNF
jgi:hypothetical protein